MKYREKDILELLGELKDYPSSYQMDYYLCLLNTLYNININAVAGSGKTTTLVNSLKLIPLTKKVIFLAFNNSIVDELRERCPSNIEVTTIHSLGWRKSLNHYEGVTLSESKVWNWCKKILKHKVPKVLQAQYFTVLSQIIDLMRCEMAERYDDVKILLDKHGYVLSEGQLEDLFMVYDIVKEDTLTFDFCDMIFQPAINSEIRFFKYDYVFVDEAQDLNKAQQKLIEKLVGQKTRLISCGDKFQAIYSFAGADAEAFEYFQNRQNTKALPLSISYRCSKNIVLKAQELVPGIEYFEKARLGRVDEDGDLYQVKSEDFILCRNTLPLVLLCVEFMKRGIKAKIKGSTDIVKKITHLLESTGEKDYKRTVGKLAKHLASVRKELIKSGFSKPEHHPKFVRTKELIQIIFYLGKDTTETKEIISKLKKLFISKEEGGVILSTIHKSKGLESNNVYLILPELLPSQYAKTPTQLQQERNLEYVAYTRAKNSLIIVRAEEFSNYVTDYRSVARKEEKRLLNPASTVIKKKKQLNAYGN